MIKAKEHFIGNFRAWRSPFVLLSFTAMAACAADPNVRRVDAPVSSISVGEPGDVSADALALAMLRVGFSPDEILDMGPSIRRSLTQSGGAQARRGGELVALLSIWQGTLYVTSSETGTFVVEA